MGIRRELTTAPEGKMRFGELVVLVVDATAIAVINVAKVDTTTAR